MKVSLPTCVPFIQESLDICTLNRFAVYICTPNQLPQQVDHWKAQNNGYRCIQKFLMQARKYMKYDLLNSQPLGMRKREKNRETRMPGERKKNWEQMQPYYRVSGHPYFLRAQRKPLINPEWSRASWFLNGAGSLHLQVSLPRNCLVKEARVNSLMFRFLICSPRGRYSDGTRSLYHSVSFVEQVF